MTINEHLLSVTSRAAAAAAAETQDGDARLFRGLSRGFPDSSGFRSPDCDKRFSQSPPSPYQHYSPNTGMYNRSFQSGQLDQTGMAATSGGQGGGNRSHLPNGSSYSSYPYF